MSSDTAHENASVVDSSVTHKHDVGNLDGPESPSYNANDNGNRSAAEERCISEKADDESTIRGCDMSGVRYFIIKSLNYENIQLSIQKGIWATQVGKERTLEEAFHNSSRVILIFSVNMSGSFQGYAQMTTPVGWRKENVWSQGMGGNSPWGRSFSVKWLQLNNLSFHKTGHLRNPLNEYKPVKISRDCQELPPVIGSALCELIDKENNDIDNFERNGVHLGWPPGSEPAYSLSDGGYNGPLTQLTWSGASMLYPSLFDQHQAELGRSSFVNQGSAGVFHAESMPPRELNGSDRSPLYSTISEDEFLEMSYEEYLEAHKSDKRLCNLEDLRNNIISIVKQSALLSSTGAENMKTRDLCDSIHEEVRDKVMSQISDGLWHVIRSADGMQTEIKDTVQSIYNDLLNPQKKGKNKAASSTHQASSINRSECNGPVVISAQTDNSLSDGELKEPPGFALAQRNHDPELQSDLGGSGHLQVKIAPPSPDGLQNNEDADPSAPPVFFSLGKRKNLSDGSDEDPDVPPGFG